MKPEKEANDIRIDKYLWAVRIFKSRSLASEAIDGGKVKLDGFNVKSSKKVKLGEKYRIKREQQVLEIEVIKIIEKRVSADLAKECYMELFNSLTDLPKVQSAFFHSTINREKGKGRPTKRDRREIDDFLK